MPVIFSWQEQIFIFSVMNYSSVCMYIKEAKNKGGGKKGSFINVWGRLVINGVLSSL